MNETPDPARLAQDVAGGDRAALARAITLVESSRPDHRTAAADLLARLLPRTGKAIRIGISGAPGVGKSTLIEHLGLLLIGRGHRLAVLAIDPSSPLSGGSILGDKTRMAELARSPHAFIRPSPSGGQLGGIARHTAEAILLVEAAGFDIVFVETVGIGQSEVAVAGLVDLFLLLLAPAGGDQLQGIKKGVVELADLLVVTKADGALAAAAAEALGDYRAALSLLRPGPQGWRPQALACSALTETGLAELWQEVERFRAAMQANGAWQRRRAMQAKALLASEIAAALYAAFLAEPAVAGAFAEIEQQVVQGKVTASEAARRLLAVRDENDKR